MTTKTKKIILPIVIIVGVIILGALAYIGLVQLANTTAHTYATSVKNAFNTVDLHNDSLALNDASGAPAMKSAINKIENDLVTTKKQLSPLAVVPLGSTLSQKYKNAQNLKNKLDTYYSQASAMLSEAEALVQLYQLSSDLQSNIIDDAGSNNFSQAANDVRASITKIKAIPATGTMLAMCNSFVDFYSGYAKDLDALASNSNDSHALSDIAFPNTSVIEAKAQAEQVHLQTENKSILTLYNLVRQLSTSL